MARIKSITGIIFTGQVAFHILPLGIVLDKAIELKVDDKLVERVNVSRCGNLGCLAVGDMRKSSVDKLKAGKDLQVTFKDGGSGKDINLIMSLQNFSSLIQSL